MCTAIIYKRKKIWCYFKLLLVFMESIPSQFQFDSVKELLSSLQKIFGLFILYMILNFMDSKKRNKHINTKTNMKSSFDPYQMDNSGLYQKFFRKIF